MMRLSCSVMNSTSNEEKGCMLLVLLGPTLLAGLLALIPLLHAVKSMFVTASVPKRVVLS